MHSEKFVNVRTQAGDEFYRIPESVYKKISDDVDLRIKNVMFNVETFSIDRLINEVTAVAIAGLLQEFIPEQFGIKHPMAGVDEKDMDDRPFESWIDTTREAKEYSTAYPVVRYVSPWFGSASAEQAEPGADLTILDKDDE